MAVQEVQVAAKDPQLDVKGRQTFQRIQNDIGVPGLKGVRTAQLYWLEGVTPQQAADFADGTLRNPVVEDFKVGEDILPPTPYAFKVPYNAASTDPLDESIRRLADLEGIPVEAAKKATGYAFYGDLTPDEMEKIAQTLHNPIIEEVTNVVPETLEVQGEVTGTTLVGLIDASLEDLRKLSKESGVFFNDAKMLACQTEARRRGRDFTDAEFQYMGGAWGDHCVHENFSSDIEFNGEPQTPLFPRIQATARRHFKEGKELSVFRDNSGVVRFYGGKAINMKGETHITPFDKEPRNGVATGVGGCQRDGIETGGGAQVFAMYDGYGISKLGDTYTPEGSLPPHTLLREGIAGAREYGNPTGIPTRGTTVIFDEQFRAKPTALLVECGIMDADKAVMQKPKPGDVFILVGGKTGRDGIHGATVSSVGASAEISQKHSSIVQVANPIEQRKVFDAIEEGSRESLFVMLQDLGAAGIASAGGEIGKFAGGIRYDLAKVPLKNKAIAEWEIHQSESQERGGVVVKAEDLERTLALMAKHEVEATVLGEITDTNQLEVYYGDKKIIDLSYEFIEKGLPKQKLIAEWNPPIAAEPLPEMPKDMTKALFDVMSHGDVCSKQPISRQYDWGVQAMDALSPYTGVHRDCPNDAGVFAPMLGVPYGWVFANEMTPRQAKVDPYNAALSSACGAVARLVAVGGNPKDVSWVNNYIGAKPSDPKIAGRLHLTVQGVCDAMDIFDTGVMSGKDSNSSEKTLPDGTVLKVMPYVNIAAGGKIPDVRQTVSADIKSTHSVLCFVGRMDRSLGGSVYMDSLGALGNEVPIFDKELTPRVFDAMHEAIKSGEVQACKTIGKGGLLATIAQMGFGGDCGVEVTIPPSGLRDDHFLFNETPGNFVVEVKSEEDARRLFGDVPFFVLGKTTGEKQLKVTKGSTTVLTADMDQLKAAWKEPMERIFG